MTGSMFLSFSDFFGEELKKAPRKSSILTRTPVTLTERKEEPIRKEKYSEYYA